MSDFDQAKVRNVSSDRHCSRWHCGINSSWLSDCERETLASQWEASLPLNSFLWVSFSFPTYLQAPRSLCLCACRPLSMRIHAVTGPVGNMEVCFSWNPKPCFCSWWQTLLIVPCKHEQMLCLLMLRSSSSPFQCHLVSSRVFQFPLEDIVQGCKLRSITICFLDGIWNNTDSHHQKFFGGRSSSTP